MGYRPAYGRGVRMTDEAGIDALKDAIKNMHGCDSAWLESVPVRETFKDKLV